METEFSYPVDKEKPLNDLLSLWIQSATTFSLSFRPILTIPAEKLLRLPSGLFCLDFSSKNLYAYITFMLALQCKITNFLATKFP